MDETAGPDAVLFVVTTVSTDTEARALAERLVGDRLAACVNALPNVRSVFRWQGEVDDAEEILLLVKTLASRWEDVKAAILAAHPYELPEIVALRAADVEEAFARWIAESCARERPEPPRKIDA